jgi:hypothetical protein
MDYARAFTFLTEDKNWVTKLIVGAVISFFSFLILPIFFLIGYMVAVTRQVLNHQELPLPEWDNWGDLFRDGIIVSVVQLVYTLPFWLLACIGGVATVGFGFISGDAPDLASAGFISTMLLIGCLALIFTIALFFITPAIFIQYVRHNEFAACFRFGEVLGIARANIVPILISALALFAVLFVLSTVTVFVSFIIPCIGSVIGWIISVLISPYIMIATGHLYGQIARNSTDKAPAY